MDHFKDVGDAQKQVTLNASTTPDSRSTDTHSHIRSCLSCRVRKVKCDRQKPCSTCSRQGVDCTYPPGPGRAPKGSNKRPNPRVLERLSHMENLIRQLERQAGTADTNPRLSTEDVLMTYASQDQDRVGTDDTKNEKSLGRLFIQDSRSCYVSNIFWANLGDQIEELRDLLHEPGYNDDDEDSDFNEQTLVDQPVTLGSNAAIMGFQSLSHSLRAYHPSLSQAVALFGVFQHNVLPVVHIFHMPTLDHIFWDALATLDQLDKDKEALLFAIYYSTVMSIDSDQCLRIMGMSRSQALRNLLFATQQALARANLLSTQSMAVLQAAVLFLSALRNEDDSSTVWSLTSLVYHLARAMGLHRDGSSFGLKPLETELRRRLWWHVCLLDVRSSEYQGCEPIVQGSSFDTRLPLNINDRDLTIDMMESPLEREGATEMTFCLIRCESISVVWKISYIPTNSSVPGQTSELSYQERLKLVEDLRHRLDERYVKHCDSTQPLFLAAATVARLITARAWLVVHYPLTRQPHQTIVPFKILWQRLFEESVKILQLSLQLSTNKDIAKWAWHSQSHVQWHAIALVLSMICSQRPSPACDQAWECVTAIYDRRNIKEDERKGALWRPIRRLMAKARYNRDMLELSRSKATSLGKNAHHILMRPVGCFQTKTVESSPALQSSNTGMLPVGHGHQPTSGTLHHKMRSQSMSWQTDPSIDSNSQQNNMGLESLWSSTEVDAFPQGMPYTTTACEIELETLDIDLMELGWI